MTKEIPKFDTYEIHPIDKFNNNLTGQSKEHIEENVDYWSVFGHLPEGGIDCIADFYYVSYAITFYESLMETVDELPNTIGNFMNKK